MATILNASTSSGLVQSADTSGDLELQSNGTTKLTVSSTGVNIPTLTATTVTGTIVQGTAVASTSGTSIDFTGIPSWAKRITVMFNGISTNGSSIPLIQLGDSGGVETTGYTASGLSMDIINTTQTTGFPLAGSWGATGALYGQAIFTLISDTTWVFGFLGTDIPSTNVKIGNGSKQLSATLDRIRITTVNGTDTFDAGSINIQYEG